MTNCLWLARAIPFPQISGDRIYSARLASALAKTGVNICFVGLGGDAVPEQIDGIEWHVVAGKPRPMWRALFSLKPLVAARFATRAYRTAVAQLAEERAWDVVIIDQYGMGWVISMRRRFGTRRPVFVFVTHDHEESVTFRQANAAQIGFLKRLFLLQNYLKTRWFERATARASDLITAITDEEARLFGVNAASVPVSVISPGYSGSRVALRRIEQSVPRRAVMFGSYKWSAKQANLKLFMDQAGRRIVDGGVELYVVGDMAEDFRADMQTRYAMATFTGFVADPSPYLNARVAIVAEPIGGGFKLKFLDYIFRGLPVIALEASTAGLPDAVLANILVYPDLSALAEGVLRIIDNTAMLDNLQIKAHAAANGLFDWQDRGDELIGAIRAVVIA